MKTIEFIAHSFQQVLTDIKCSFLLHEKLTDSRATLPNSLIKAMLNSYVFDLDSDRTYIRKSGIAYFKKNNWF